MSKRGSWFGLAVTLAIVGFVVAATFAESAMGGVRLAGSLLAWQFVEVLVVVLVLFALSGWFEGMVERKVDERLSERLEDLD